MIAALVLAASSVVSGPPETMAAPPPAAPSPLVLPRTNDALERLRAQHFAALSDARVSLDVRNGTVREAFNAFVRALPLPCLVRYADDPVGFGIEPKTVIDDLLVTDRPALEILQDLLAICEQHGPPCTWQLRRGFLEVGTKARLNAPAAREIRMYPMTDLRMDIPSVAGKARGPAAGALDLLGDIVETIEPGTWDVGQERAVSGDGVRVSRGAAPARDTRPLAGMKPPTSRVVYRAPKYPALIRMWRDVLIVDAPPYYHRQIDGLRPPVRRHTSP